MTRYTIHAAAQELGVPGLLLRMVCITHGIMPVGDTITEAQVEAIKPTLHKMKERYYDDENAD